MADPKNQKIDFSGNPATAFRQMQEAAGIPLTPEDRARLEAMEAYCDEPVRTVTAQFPVEYVESLRPGLPFKFRGKTIGKVMTCDKIGDQLHVTSTVDDEGDWAEIQAVLATGQLQNVSMAGQYKGPSG